MIARLLHWPPWPSEHDEKPEWDLSINDAARQAGAYPVDAAEEQPHGLHRSTQRLGAPAAR